MSKFRSPVTSRIASLEDADRSRRALEESVRELQDLPSSSLRIVAGVELADGIATPIAHKLGRAPAWAQASIVRGASSTGRIVETRAGAHDRTQVIVLTATGHGATITIDLAVL